MAGMGAEMIGGPNTRGTSALDSLARIDATASAASGRTDKAVSLVALASGAAGIAVVVSAEVAAAGAAVVVSAEVAAVVVSPEVAMVGSVVLAAAAACLAQCGQRYL